MANETSDASRADRQSAESKSGLTVRSTLNGLVLTGGRSTRMGEDKSLLSYHGKPQREHVTDLLRPYCAEVFWSVNADQATDLTDSPQLYIVDAFDIGSPLNGILSAFQRRPDVAWLVVACDMPRLTNQTLDALITGRNPQKVATTFYDSDGKEPEPLLTIYEPSILPILRQRLAEGIISPRKILMEINIEMLTVPDVRDLLNVNDPETRATWQQ